MIRHPGWTCAGVPRGYVDFHEPPLAYRGDLVVGTFAEVVTSEVGLITRRVNARFGTAFAEFEPTEEIVARCMREIDEHWREGRGGSGEHLERIVPRPSAVRDGMKDKIRNRYRREVSAGLHERADRLDETFASAGADAAERP